MRILQSLRWKNLKIGWKYGIALLISIILFIGSMGIIFKLMNNVKGDINSLQYKADHAVEIAEVIALFNDLDVQVSDYIIFQTPQLIEDFRDKMQKFEALLSDLEAKVTVEGEQTVFDSIRNNNKEISDVFLNEIVYNVVRNNRAQYTVARKKLTGLRLENDGLLQQLQGTLKEKRDIAIQNANQSLNTTIFILIISVAVSAVTGFFIMFTVTRVVQRHLNEVVKLSDQIANGNLAIQKISYNGNDEIGQLAQAFNIMLNNLRSIIQQITAAAKEVGSQSEKLMQSSNEVRQGSEQVALTMEQLSAGAEEQASSSTDIVNFINILNNKIMQANKESELLTSSTNELMEMANKGNALMESSMHQMDIINEIVQSSVVKVSNLDKKSQEISHLVQIINNIAEQTNLLALNAAIEAARAGESGRGFAVVAEEIRKLAEQVGSSVSGITNIIKGIQDESKTVVDALQKGYKQVEEGTGQIKITGETFKRINSEVTLVAHRVNNVADNLIQIAKSSEEVSTSVDQVASISEETAAGVEQTSASVQQQHSAMEVIAENAKALSNLAEDLNNMVSMFKL